MTLSQNMMETVAEHLSQDVEDVSLVETTATVAEIEAGWNEFARDLGHLSRDDRRAVLQRSRPFSPAMIDGLAVRLYRDVQATKGQTRRNAAVVDCGDVRLIAVC